MRFLINDILIPIILSMLSAYVFTESAFIKQAPPDMFLQ